MINNSRILLRNNGSQKTVESHIQSIREKPVEQVYNQWKHPEKASFKNKGEIKTIPDFKKGEFVVNRPELPEMLKVMLQAKGGNFTQEEMEAPEMVNLWVDTQIYSSPEFFQKTYDYLKQKRITLVW